MSRPLPQYVAGELPQVAADPTLPSDIQLAELMRRWLVEQMVSATRSPDERRAFNELQQVMSVVTSRGIFYVTDRDFANARRVASAGDFSYAGRPVIVELQRQEDLFTDDEADEDALAVEYEDELKRREAAAAELVEKYGNSTQQMVTGLLAELRTGESA